MNKQPGAIVVFVLLLCTLPSCSTNEPPAETVAEVQQCHGAYVADVDTNAPGEPTQEAAAAAWATSPIAPSGAPTDGWEEVDSQTLRSGDWSVGLNPTLSGGWLVSGLGCQSPQT